VLASDVLKRTRGVAVGALAVAGGMVVGCAPSLSTFQAAHVAPKGHFAASGGLEGGIPVGAISDLYDAGKTAAQKAKNGTMLTPTEKWEMFDAGVNLLLTMPSIGPHVLVAYTPLDRLELSARYAGSAWRGGARYQILDHTTGPFDFTVGLGISRFAFSFPLSDQIPYIKVDDFTRWQVDVPILIGTSRDWFRAWVGPKLLLTTFSTKMTLDLPNDPTVASFEGTAGAIGGQGGFAVGYKKVWVGLELTLAEALGTAHLTVPVLGTHDTHVSSFTIFPSIGLLVEI
jgi:hypothetical protein